MIDIKKHMCLYILNNFGIFSDGNFLTDAFLNEKQIVFEISGENKNKIKKINIYGALFELNDFSLKIFSANTISGENHSIIIIDNKYIGLAYNPEHSLISTYLDNFSELSILNICDFIKSIELFKQLFIKPVKVEINEDEYKIFLKYINYSFDRMEENESS